MLNLALVAAFENKNSVTFRCQSAVLRNDS